LFYADYVGFWALYQGTTLVGPQTLGKELGFSPCAFGSLCRMCLGRG